MIGDQDENFTDKCWLVDGTYGLAGKRTLCTSPERPPWYEENEPVSFNRQGSPTYGDMLSDGFNAMDC